MRTPEDIVQGLKHKGYVFLASVRKGPEEFPRFVVFQNQAGQKAVLMYTAYEQGEVLLPSEGFAGSVGSQ